MFYLCHIGNQSVFPEFFGINLNIARVWMLSHSDRERGLKRGGCVGVRGKWEGAQACHCLWLMAIWTGIFTRALVKGDGGTLTEMCRHRQAIKSWPLCKQHGLVSSAAVMPTEQLPLSSQSHASFMTSGTKPPSDVLSSHWLNAYKIQSSAFGSLILFGCDMSCRGTYCTVLNRIIVHADFYDLWILCF